MINRGNLTVWFDEDLQDIWYASAIKGMRERGRPQLYSDACIELGLTIRSLFRFPLRATQGFLEGFFKLMNIDLKVPHYSRLSRRAAGLQVKYYSKRTRRKPIDLVVDSTGLKIYGEGEWKMRTHGKSKRRAWRKLHVAIDPETFETVSLELTDSNIHDDQVMPALMEDQKKIGSVYADGAYVSKNCFDAIAATGAKAVIALRSGTSLVKKAPSPGQVLRNTLVKEIWKANGRGPWKKLSDYHRRSLVETHMYRFKTILGPKLSNRAFTNQTVESKIKTKILNRMTKLGMPDSYKVI